MVYYIQWKDFLEGIDENEYVEKMSKSGTWADHVAIQGLVEATNIKLKIISSLGPAFDRTLLPKCGDWKTVVWVGHLAEVHYISIALHDTNAVSDEDSSSGGENASPLADCLTPTKNELTEPSAKSSRCGDWFVCRIFVSQTRRPKTIQKPLCFFGTAKHICGDGIQITFLQEKVADGTVEEIFTFREFPETAEVPFGDLYPVPAPDCKSKGRVVGFVFESHAVKKALRHFQLA